MKLIGAFGWITISLEAHEVKNTIKLIKIRILFISQTSILIFNILAKFRIYNFAPKPLTSVFINWSVYGQTQSPYYWTGNLASQDSIDVEVGSFDFGTANIPVPITAWTSYPNGLPDEVPTNDTLSTQVYKALAGGTYTVGGREPDFADLIEFTSFISY
ncbi:MAG: hypothetical protein ACK42G_03165 [Candidatus Kapaibacteriota bacterium]